MNTEFKKPKKADSSWKNILVNMEPGQVERFSLEDAGTIKPIISSDIKNIHPGRWYPVNAKLEPGVLIVARAL